MKKPDEFTMADALKDFTEGARIYIKDIRGNITLQLRVVTLRPLMWFIFANGTGSIQPGYWDATAQDTVRYVAQQLLESGMTEAGVRTKLELLMAFYDAPREDRAFIGEELKRVQAAMDVELKELKASRRYLQPRTRRPQ